MRVVIHPVCLMGWHYLALNTCSSRRQTPFRLYSHLGVSFRCIFVMFSCSPADFQQAVFRAIFLDRRASPTTSTTLEEQGLTPTQMVVVAEDYLRLIVALLTSRMISGTCSSCVFVFSLLPYALRRGLVILSLYFLQRHLYVKDVRCLCTSFHGCRGQSETDRVSCDLNSLMTCVFSVILMRRGVCHFSDFKAMDISCLGTTSD